MHFFREECTYASKRYTIVAVCDPKCEDFRDLKYSWLTWFLSKFYFELTEAFLIPHQTPPKI